MKRSVMTASNVGCSVIALRSIPAFITDFRGNDTGLGNKSIEKPSALIPSPFGGGLGWGAFNIGLCPHPSPCTNVPPRGRGDNNWTRGHAPLSKGKQGRVCCIRRFCRFSGRCPSIFRFLKKIIFFPCILRRYIVK